MVALTKATNEQKAYMAGIIDGEGTIRIKKTFQKVRPCYVGLVKIEMTNVGPIELMSKYFGGNYYTYGPRKENWKTTYTYSTNHSERVYTILKELLPYLEIKKQQALAVIHFLETKNKGIRDLNLFEKMFLGVKRLNGSIV